MVYGGGQELKYYFIVNPGAKTGNGSGLWEELEKMLRASSGTEYEVFFTNKDESAAGTAASICRQHPETKRIVIVGGDGTINEVINGLSDYGRIFLGIIPAGSGNDLVRGLGIPSECRKAFSHVLHPREFRSVDHGLLEYLDDDTPSRKFAVSSGIGYDAEICYQALRSPLKKLLNKLRLKISVYFLIGLKLIFTNRRAGVVLTVDGRNRLKYDKVIFIAAMNTLYEGGGYPMAPGADPGDGRLSLCVVEGISRLKHCFLMTKIGKGEHVKSRGVHIIHCRNAEIEADRPLVMHTDGEFAGKHSHVRFSCLPEKIRMML